MSQKGPGMSLSGRTHGLHGGPGFFSGTTAGVEETKPRERYKLYSRKGVVSKQEKSLKKT